MGLVQFFLLPAVWTHVLGEVGSVEDEGVERVLAEPVFPHVLGDLLADLLGLHHLQACRPEVPDHLVGCHQAAQELRRTDPNPVDLVGPEDLDEVHRGLPDGGGAVYGDGRVVVDLRRLLWKLVVAPLGMPCNH
jgi:hypothetical protein